MSIRGLQYNELSLSTSMSLISSATTSGDAMRDKIVTALDRGAKTFIAKPFNRKRLLDIVAEFIAYKKNQR